MARKQRTITKLNLVGQRFGRLVVLERAGNNHYGHVEWVVECDCGKRRIVLAQSLTRGDTRSCGCLRNENSRRLAKLFRPPVRRTQLSHAQLQRVYAARSAPRGELTRLAKEFGVTRQALSHLLRRHEAGGISISKAPALPYEENAA